MYLILALIDDNLSDDAKCANEIFNSEGFKNWKGWVKKCKGNNRLPDITRCPDFLEASKTPEMKRESVTRQISAHKVG